MRRFVILLNFLLITLIIFNFLNKTDTLIENLEGCPDNKKNMVYKQKAKTEQLLNELNELRTEIMALKTSTNTNKSNLNGREIVSGDSMCIPRASRMFATTISTTMNGRNIRKPIWKASFSSEITKEGTRTVKSSGVKVARSFGLRSCFARLKNIFRSFIWLCLARNFLIGSLALNIALTNTPMVAPEKLPNAWVAL